MFKMFSFVAVGFILFNLNTPAAYAENYGTEQFTGGMIVMFCPDGGDCMGTVLEFPIKVTLDVMNDYGSYVMYSGNVLMPHPEYPDDFSVNYNAQTVVIKETGKKYYYYYAGFSDNTTPDEYSIIGVNTNWWLDDPSDLDKSPVSAEYGRKIQHGDKIFAYPTVTIGKFKPVYDSLVNKDPVAMALPMFQKYEFIDSTHVRLITK